MISKHGRRSWIIIAVFLISMVLPGFVQPTQAVDPISPISVTLGGMTADGAVQVAVDSPLLIAFTENVSLPMGYENYVSVQYSQDGLIYSEPLSGIYVSPVFDKITGAPTNVISVKTSFSNCNWGENLKYRVSLNTGAIIGLESGAYNEDITVNFQTVDTVGPEINGSNMTNPQHSDTNVPLTTAITATYSEAVIAGPSAGNIKMEEYQPDANIPVPISYNFDGFILEITVDQSYTMKNGTAYTVTIPAGAAEDEAGNPQLYERVFSFTTIGSETNSTISGTVTAQAGGGLAGIAVMAMDIDNFQDKYYGETVETGAYTIEVSPLYKYFVIANPRDGIQPYANSFYSSAGGVSLPLESATTVDPGASGIDFALAPGGSIAGVVTDGNGNPLQNITVRCQQTNGNGWYDWAFTDENGSYNVGGLPYGTYTISAPAAIEPSYEDLAWVQSQLTAISVSSSAPITALNLSLNPVDHPVVTNIWPTWIPAGTTESWINLNGLGFNTLGSNPTLKLTVKDQTNTDVVVAESTEINKDAGGYWLSAKVHSVAAAGVTAAGIYNAFILLTDNNNTNIQFICDPWIGITSEPMISGEIAPWAISGQGSAILNLRGANLTSLGTAPIAVYMANKADPLQRYVGTAEVAENSQYLTASFDFGTEILTSGSYFIAADEPSTIIHGMVDEVDFNDTVAAVEVVTTPAVTGAYLQKTNEGADALLVEGVNFTQFTPEDLAAMKGVFTLQGGTAVNPFIQAVTKLSDAQIQVLIPENMPNGNYYNFDLVGNFGLAGEKHIPRTVGFDYPAPSGPAWVMLNPNHIDSGYEAVTITATQETQQVWKASDALTIRLFRMGATTAVKGFDNLSPTTDSVTDTGFTFTLPAGLGQGVYWAEIISADNVIAKGRLQIGGPWNTINTLQVGYGITTMTVNQEDSAFWQAGNDLTLSIMQATATEPVSPPGFSDPINVAGATVTDTSFSFTLARGLPIGNYFVQIDRGDENLTGAPFGVIASVPSEPGLTLTFKDEDIDHVYFDGNNISFEIALSQLSGAPDTPLTIIPGVWTDATNFVTNETVPSLKNYTAALQSGKLVVSGQVNNPGNNTLLTGCLGINVIIPQYAIPIVENDHIGPFGIVDSNGSNAIVGVQMPLPQGVVSEPVLTAIPDLANVTDLKFTKTGFGSIQFLNPIDLIHSAAQAQNMSNGIQVDYDSTGQKYHVAVDTAALNFLAGKAARIEIFDVPYTSIENLAIITNAVGGEYSQLALDVNNNLSFNVNHFSEYAVYELPPDAVISLDSDTYDRSSVPLGDLQATITWNQSSSITNVQFMCPDNSIPNYVPVGTSYWIVQDNKLIIKKEFLLKQKEQYTYTFNVTFNTGNPATISAKVINNPSEPIPLIPNQFTAGSPIAFNLNLSTMYFSTPSRIAVVKDTNNPPAQVLPAMLISGYDYVSQVSWAGNMLNIPGQYQLMIYDGDPTNPSAKLKATGNFTVIPPVGSNTAPTASNVAISGIAAVGQVLTANYSYADADNDLQGATKFQWYTSESVPGNYTPIEGATASTYTITEAELGKFISVWVTPVAEAGFLQGTTVVSLATEQVAATPPASNDNCFIATAAYGSKFQPSVALLRQFRDHFLMTNDPGRAFVAFYYKNSPPIADYISKSEIFKAIVRVLLTPVVGIAYLMFHTRLLYALMIFFAFVLLLLIKNRRKIPFSA